MTGRNRNHDATWIRDAVERYEGSLVRFAARLIGDVERARDVVQDTFLRLCREDRAKVQGHLAEWLFTVCRRRALDVSRKESRMKPLSDDRAHACQSREADHALAVQQHETAGQLIAILNRLPANQQEVVRLKLQNGLSYREISRVTGLSVSNVGYLIHTAIKTIREEYASQTGHRARDELPCPLNRTTPR